MGILISTLRHPRIMEGDTHDIQVSERLLVDNARDRFLRDHKVWGERMGLDDMIFWGRKCSRIVQTLACQYPTVFRLRTTRMLH